MKKVETYGSIKDGILKISYRDKFNECIKQMPDCRVKVVVEKLYKKRSTYTYNEETGKEGRGQSGYYWFIIVTSFQQGWLDLTGEHIDKQQSHERLKFYCNYKEVANEKTGEILKLPQSTSSQSTIEAEEFYQRCRDWIYENMNIKVSLPNEQGELELNNLT